MVTQGASASGTSTSIRRGTVWWAELPEPIGSEPGHRRPVLVIQIDDFNRSRIGTIIAIAITSHLTLADAPGNVFLPAREAGLPRDSVANVSQVVTLEKKMLVGELRRVQPETMRAVELGLRLVLGL